MTTESELGQRALDRMSTDDLRKTAEYADRKAEEADDLQRELELVGTKGEALELLEEERNSGPEWEELSPNGKAREDVDRFLEEEGLDEYAGVLDDTYRQKVTEGLEVFPGRKPRGVVAAVVRDQEWANKKELAYDFDISEGVISNNSEDLGLIHGEQVDHLERRVVQLQDRFSNFETFNQEYDGVLEAYCEDVPGATPQEMGAVLELEVTPEYVGRSEEDVISYFGTDEEGFQRATEYKESWEERQSALSEK